MFKKARRPEEKWTASYEQLVDEIADVIIDESCVTGCMNALPRNSPGSACPWCAGTAIVKRLHELGVLDGQSKP